MIKINKKERPNELTDALAETLTNEYRETGKSVWKQPYIEAALRESTFDKCCYCECKINQESKYMEVEHYHDKNKYPHLVVDWDNLLPSCKRCNGRKSSYDTLQNPFINPAITDPKEHLVYNAYRFYPKTIEGKNTIEQLSINAPDRMVIPRFEITEAIHKQLEDLLDRIENYSSGRQRTSYNKNKILDTIESLLKEGLPQAEYSATVSSSMIESPHFLRVIELIKKEQLWDQHLDNLLKDMSKTSLDTDLKIVSTFLSKQSLVNED